MNLENKTIDLNEWKRAKEVIEKYYDKEFGKEYSCLISDFIPLAFTTIDAAKDITLEAGVRIHYDYNASSYYEFVRQMSNGKHHATFIDRYYKLKDLNEYVLIDMEFDQLIYFTEGERYLFDHNSSNLEVIYYH